MHRLDSCASDRRLGSRDDLGVTIEHAPHVSVLLLDLELERRLRLPLDDLRRELSNELHVLRELLVVVVAGDQHERRRRGVPEDPRRMDEPLAVLGRLR